MLIGALAGGLLTLHVSIAATLALALAIGSALALAAHVLSGSTAACRAAERKRTAAAPGDRAGTPRLRYLTVSVPSMPAWRCPGTEQKNL